VAITAKKPLKRFGELGRLSTALKRGVNGKTDFGQTRFAFDLRFTSRLELSCAA
jgi:hypothetical protein